MRIKFDLLSLLFLLVFFSTAVVKGHAGSTNLLKTKDKANFLKSLEERITTTIEGLVIDEDGEPLIGVNVLLKGTDKGTATDFNGYFTLDDVSSGDVLIVSYVGYQTQEVSIGEEGEIEIVLVSDSQLLDEVVVVGYGSRLKGELTGAVSEADSKVFESRPLTSTMDALQGTLPGVTITRGSGRPGNENYSLEIRGASSMSGSKVLVLIDGIPGDLNLLNPNDIENVTVLKDAAAAIYGARAADGVVLVTTKTGTTGSPNIHYSGNFGMKKPQFLKRRTNTLQLAEMYDEGMRNVNQLGVSEEIFDKIRNNAEPDPTGWLKFLENFPGFYQSHNWIDDVYGTGIQQTHNLSISGGSDRNKYLFSAGYERNEGVYRYGENKAERFNLRMNYDFKVRERMNIETRTSIENQPVSEPSALGDVLYFVNQVGSYVPIYNPLGQLYKYQGGFRNPIQYLLEAGQHETNSLRLSTNIKGTINITENLDWIGQVGINTDVINRKMTHPTFTQYNWDGTPFDVVNDPNSAEFSDTRNLYQNYTTYIDYNKLFQDKHRISAMLGVSRETFNTDGKNITGYNFASNELFTLNLADRTKTAYANFSGNASEWALHSAFSRLGYSYRGKYLIDFTTRLDGSSKFSDSKRWSALFPSISVAWNITEEDFMQSQNWIEYLKVRGSWGQSGNQELGFGNYDYISLINITGNYPLGSPNVGVPGAVSSIASENRTWETIETKNIGLDFAFIDSRLNGSLDFYIKTNRDMLVNDELPATLGGSAPTQNLGKLVTRGWDFMIGWNDKIGNFSYSISGMLSDNQNKLIELKGNDSYGEGLIHAREGYPLNSYFGYEFIGIIQDQNQLEEYKNLENIPTDINIGDVMFKDVDGDGIITAFGDPAKGTSGDLVYLGNLQPRFIYSSNIDLSFKNFHLGIFLQGVGKRDGIRTGEFSRNFTWVWMQPLEYFYGKNWTPENPDAKYPRIIPGSVGFDEVADWNWRYSAMRANNLAYFKFKVITLAYDLPQPFIQKLKIGNARIYFSGQDLITISKDTWNRSFNPEEIWERSDEQTYPFSGVFSIGLDIKF